MGVSISGGEGIDLTGLLATNQNQPQIDQNTQLQW